MISGRKKGFPPLRSGTGVLALFRFAEWFFWGTLILTFGAFYLLWGYQEVGVPFQSDIQILRPSSQTRFQEKLKSYFHETNVIYVVQKAKTQEELLKQLHQSKKTFQQLQKSGLISHYRSIVDFVPETETQQSILQQIREQVDGNQIVSSLKESLEKYGFRTDPTSEFFGPFDPQKTTYAPYLQWLEKQLLQPELLSLSDLNPPELKPATEAFLQKSGDSLIAISYLFPIPELDHRKIRQSYLEELHRILPESCKITGLPVLMLHLEEFIFRSFYQAVYWSAFFIIFFVVLHFRSWAAILALLPMFLGCLWMLATIKFLGFPLNFMNIIVIPMVMGLGIDDGVYFMTHYLESNNLRQTLQETGIAIFLTSATTIAGFGSLAFSKNAGLVSMGLLASLGTLYCLLVSLFFLPILLSKTNFFRTKITEKN